MSDAETLRLILKAFKDCNQKPTREAVAKQFKHETGKELYADDTPTTADADPGDDVPEVPA